MHSILQKLCLFRTPYLFPQGWMLVILAVAIIGVVIGIGISDDCLRLRGLL